MAGGGRRESYDGNAGAHESNCKLIGNVTRDLAVLRTRLDGAQRNHQPIAGSDKKCRRRRQSVDEEDLPLPGLRWRLAIAAPVLDRKSSEMRQATVLCNVHDFRTRRAMQQFAPRELEPDIAKHGAGRLAEKTPELALQCSARHPRDIGQIGQTPIATYIRAHRVECAPDAARQQRSA